ncbi:MAG: DUF3095 domain-containing protein [Nitrospina sp.]|jgi:hypothetical protein|nr:DUF3095 domain-containing protein [Nitrospina sp.]MBT3856135.1 DUF3095 domain-containing protein [Nitrospina sp.]MBT4047400.1 DUF3095 domain-containing protein [Nitrospina sp.]MBT4557771.1 DUF3095 domain-containing protein [Nitrospina sp.]MBT5348460.1 DUF3095 domain-containing protein [Nitrospina sp.]
MQNNSDSSKNFYAELPIFMDFMGVTDAKNFHTVPDDWMVVVSDIKGSTKAIESGRYKDVNILGASSIISVLNCTQNIEIPFVFGGDGASFVIPKSLRKPVEKALNGTRRLAQASFEMDLRIGIVPVKIVVKGGAQVRIAKMQVSPWGTLAMFSGGGLAYAEKLIKDPETSATYEIQNVSDDKEDKNLFDGLECRWEPIHSKKGETVCLMVLARGDDDLSNAGTYSRFIDEIRKIYGTQKDYSPISPSQLKVTLNAKLLSSETKVRTFNKNLFTRLVYPLLLRGACVLGKIIFKFGLRIGDLDGEAYLNTLTKNSDFQKFDDTLRMTIDSTTEQREKLVEYLEAQMHAGSLVYGIQISDSALMTCMVFDRKDRHLHFVDGASGGYALAAKQMKSQMTKGKNN